MEVHFYMAKLALNQKIEIYKKRKEGITLSTLSKEYSVNVDNIKYLIRLVDIHGIDILRKAKNRYYSPELKLEIMNKVLMGRQSMTSTAIEYGLPNKGILCNWIHSYKANGYVIVERKKGRTPTMKKQVNKFDSNDKDAIIKQKDEEILKLKAEIDYLKKLRAVVQARKNQQLKKK